MSEVRDDTLSAVFMLVLSLSIEFHLHGKLILCHDLPCRYDDCLQDCAVAIYAQDDCKNAHLHKASALVRKRQFWACHLSPVQNTAGISDRFTAKFL